MLNGTDEPNAVRLLEIGRKAGASCGFQLTRSRWDPYPWVSLVEEGSAAALAGLRPGDCLLRLNGEDVVGRRVSEVAEIVKSKPEQVSLLLWNAGSDAQCSPEAVCCGPMPTNLQRLSACMSTILAFLECPICLDTIAPPTYQCENGHVICIRCRAKSERCPVCRLRFGRGRSLLADQVYSALVDAFNLREIPDDARTKKMKEIFNTKAKAKKKNVPDIKITHSHTNKFLARLVGKSTSVDNLSHSKCTAEAGLSTPNAENFLSNNLKKKSLSNQEIFYSESLVLSRAGSVNRLSRNTNSNEQFSNLGIEDKSINNRPASYHGSFESLPNNDCFNTLLCSPKTDAVSVYCPFQSECADLINDSELVEHYQQAHEGPLIHYFTPNVIINLEKIIKHKTLSYVIKFEQKTFFLKLELIGENHKNIKICKAENVLLWTWLLGDKNEAGKYDMQIKVINDEVNDVILSVRNSICSLHLTSYLDICDKKKGVLLNMKTFQHFGDVVFNINIVRNECD